MNYLRIKRVLGFSMALCGVVLLAPLYILIAICIKLDSKGPVIFKQTRLGQYNKPFTIYKFRTMVNHTPHAIPTHRLTHPHTWITPFGRILRRCSLDELPQLFNVIKGDMAFIGPRPALENQSDLIAKRCKDTISLPVGISGWAQVHGRDALSLEEKAQYDCFYAKHISLTLDIKCLFMTVLSVFMGSGVVEGGNPNES